MQDFAERDAISSPIRSSEPVPRPVSPVAFVSVMTQRWSALGNTPSAPLKQLWSILADTFGDAITFPDKKWRVLQLQTGTGKTQGLCVYAAMTITENLTSPAPIGILVVTRTIRQADEIVVTIRSQLSAPATDRVQAKHSENKLPRATTDAADVLVITHSAFTRVLDEGHAERGGRWEKYANWAHGPRRLIIIDEALSGLVEENQVNARQIGLVLTCLDGKLRRQFPTEFRALRILWDALHFLDMRAARTKANNVVGIRPGVIWTAADDGFLPFPRICPMVALREAMSSIPYDQIVLSKNSSDDRNRIRLQVEETLGNCEALIRRWCYFHQKGRDATLNSSQLLIPSDLPGPVVLDATAAHNFLWTLLESRALLVPIPKGARSYSNVSLHVARSSRGLGKGTMRDAGKARIPRLLAELERRLSPNRKVLLCLHKDIEPLALACRTAFASFSVTHWGDIDGKNEWVDHDTAVIFGLPYPCPVRLTNMFFALQGLQSDEWLGEPSWGSYPDVRQEMETGQLTASIIQAINRVRCRRVIDAEGNCPPADIFIVLGAGEEGDVILARIQEDMPGVVVKPWLFELDGPEEHIRQGSSHEALLALMRGRLPGETPMSFIRKELSLTKSAYKSLLEVLRDETHYLCRALAAIGVRYVARGPGKAGFLLKSST